MVMSFGRTPTWERNLRCINCGSVRIKTVRPSPNNDIEDRKIKCRNCLGYYEKAYDKKTGRKVRK